MNGTFFQNPNFNNENTSNECNILKDNITKKVKVYTEFLDNEKNSKIFSGIFEAYKDSFLIISDPSSGSWYLIPLNIISYIEFEEKISF